MMKKKLIFVSQALWIGGIETALVNLLNQLDYDRYDITCLILRDYRNLADRLPAQCRLLVADRDRQITFAEPYAYRRMFHLMEKPQTTSKLRIAEWKALQAALRGIEMDRYAAYIKRQLRGEHFDTCIIYSDRCAEVAVKAVKANRFLMYYHHGAMRREFHDEYGYRRSEKVIAVSEKLAQRLREYRPQYAEKIIAINNLVDVDGVRRNSLEPPEITFPKNAFNLVSCGRIAKEKGMDLAAEACAKLIEDGMTDLQWWIIGGGPAEEELREQVRGLGIEEHFHLLGMQKNPYPYICQADLYVQPSRVESFGLTIMEAMVLDKPVLATKTFGAREIVEAGAGIKLCEISAEAIFCAVNKLSRKEISGLKESKKNESMISSWNATRISKLNALLS